MNRKEAIRCLQRTKQSYDTMPKVLRKAMEKYPPNADECSQAIDMAIKALNKCPQNDTDIGTINALKETETKEHDDLIIKNGKGIQDGLYNVNNGEIFKFKAKGGTVRTYKLVPSVSAERVNCDSCIYKTMWQEQEKAETLDRHTLDVLQERFEAEELKAHAKSSGLKEHATWNKAIRILEEYMEEGDNDND